MGVKVKRNKRSGKLAFRVIWSELPGQSETEKAEARKVANSKTFPWWSQRESNPFHLASEQSPKTVVSQDSCDDFTQPDAASLPAVSSDKNTSFKGRK